MKQHVSSEQRNVASHGAHAEEVKQEVTCVVSTDAVVHPHTVVVKTLDTPVADPTVFGACRFDQLAGWTGDSWVKQPPVIRVDAYLASNLLLCHCAWISLDAEVEEEGLDKQQDVRHRQAGQGGVHLSAEAKDLIGELSVHSDLQQDMQIDEHVVPLVEQSVQAPLGELLEPFWCEWCNYPSYSVEKDTKGGLLLAGVFADEDDTCQDHHDVDSKQSEEIHVSPGSF